MSGNLRWVSLGLLLTCGLMAQVVRHQAEELTQMRAEAEVDPHAGVIAQLEAELETARVELSVRNVLDNNHINVPAEQKRAIAQTIIEMGQRYELPSELILAVIFTESSFDVAAESDRGALGLMQLMPATAAALASELEVEWKGQQLLTNPQINILLGSFYLRRLIHRFDDLDMALAAYNVGPTRLQSILSEFGRAPQRYSRKVGRVREGMLRDHF